MFDINLRPLKDTIFDPISSSIPDYVSPTQITGCAFIAGLLSSILICLNQQALSLLFWILNRFLDCLDGAVARHRKQESDLGGFLDLLCDFIVYSLIPISCCIRNLQADRGDTLACHDNVEGLVVVALLEASFWINNFVLFYIAALNEKHTTQTNQRAKKELTSVTMQPALIEGFESGLFFTVMLILPHYVKYLSIFMSVGVGIGTAQRVLWLVQALKRIEKMPLMHRKAPE